MTADIIPFPKQSARLESPVPSYEDLKEAKVNTSEHSVELSSEILATAFVDNLIALGYPVGSLYTKDICFVAEAIKSLMSKFYNKEHAYQSLAELSFHQDKNTGEMNFTHPKVKLSKKPQGNTAPSVN